MKKSTLAAASLSLLVLTSLDCPQASAQERSAELGVLIRNSGLVEWWFKKNPPPFEQPDGTGRLRSLDRDFKGNIVLLYMFAEW